MNRRLMQVRDLFAMRAHNGWAHVLLSRVHSRVGGESNGIGRAIGSTLNRMNQRTQLRSEQFDIKHGTEIRWQT